MTIAHTIFAIEMITTGALFRKSLFVHNRKDVCPNPYFYLCLAVINRMIELKLKSIKIEKIEYKGVPQK
jgi:hypothetical protein